VEANIIFGIVALIGSILAIGKSIDDKNKCLEKKKYVR